MANVSAYQPLHGALNECHILHQNQQKPQKYPHKQKQKNCSETIHFGFTSNSYSDIPIERETTCTYFESLEFEMLEAMQELDNQTYTDTAVNEFFDRIIDINQRKQTSVDRILTPQTYRHAISREITTMTSTNANQIATTDCSRQTLVPIPIYYQNIRSVPAKENLYQNLQSTIYDVICLTETWFTANHKTETYIPPRFAVHRLDRNSSNSEYNRAGGVAILINAKYKSKRLRQFENIDVEGICVEIKINRNSFILYLAYVPELDHGRDVAFKKHTNCIEQVLNSATTDLIVIGDFNMRGVKWQQADDSNHLIPINIPTNDKFGYREFLTSMQYMSLLQMVHISNDAGNFLDLIFTRNESLLSIHHAPTSLTNIKQTDSPHPPIEIALNVTPENRPCVDHIEVLAYSRGNYTAMNNELNAINYAAIFHGMSVEEAFDYMYDTLNKAIKKHIPIVKIKCRPNKPKWWNAEMQRLKNKRNKEWKRLNGGNPTEQYEKALNEFNELNEKRYSEYINDIQDKFKTNPALFWKFARERTKSSNYPSTMSYKNVTVDSPQEIANLFADCFQTFYRSDNTNIDLNSLLAECSTDCKEISISMFDIEFTIDQIKFDGAVGADGISPKVIRFCSESLVWPLWILFQKTWESGVIPDRLKKSRIIPIHKKGDKMDIEQYRMVAVGTMFLQIYEKTLNRKLSILVENQLSTSQHGFRSGRSVSTNLLSLSIAAHDAFSRGNQIDVFYGDFEKAFDRVNHNIMLRKLVAFNLGSMSIKWIASFLQNRGNYVQIGKSKSYSFTSSSGVGAGTSLGPLLFLLFIDDLTRISKCKGTNILLFADDVKMYREVATPTDALKLRGDLKRMAVWCTENELKLNIDKCFMMSLRRSNNHHINDYHIDGKMVARVDEIRDLGVIVDSRMNFISHIESSVAKARQMTGYIKWLSNGRFHLNTLRLLYTAYVRSKLEFAAPIWDPFQANYKSDIESIQKQFLLYLLGDNIRRPPYRIVPYVDRCKLVKLQPLYTRRTITKLLMAYDLVKNNLDPSISSKLVRTDNSRRVLRHQNILVEQTYRNEYSHWQPIACMIRLINQYSECYVNSQSKYDFKNLVYKKLSDDIEDDL